MAERPIPVQPNPLVAEALRCRREAVDRMNAARDRGFLVIAQDYEPIIAGWDAMLARHGIKGD